MVVFMVVIVRVVLSMRMGVIMLVMLMQVSVTTLRMSSLIMQNQKQMAC